MGCNNSKAATVHVSSSEHNLGSEGSSSDYEDPQDLFIKKRTWGSPAPPLPHITSPKNNDQSYDCFITSTAEPTKSEDTMQPDNSLRMERLVQQKGGAAFVIQDDNMPKSTPPRRLQAIKGPKKLTMDELIRKQRGHEENRNKILREQIDNLSRHNSKCSGKELRDLAMAGRTSRRNAQVEKRWSKVLQKQETVRNERVKKVREHNQKVAHKKKSARFEDANNENLNFSGRMEHDMEYNKSESESWADNDSIKNIYDQMEFITPASGLASAVSKTNHSDDEFFS